MDSSEAAGGKNGLLQGQSQHVAVLGKIGKSLPIGIETDEHIGIPSLGKGKVGPQLGTMFFSFASLTTLKIVAYSAEQELTWQEDKGNFSQSMLTVLLLGQCLNARQDSTEKSPHRETVCMT